MGPMPGRTPCEVARRLSFADGHLGLSGEVPAGKCFLARIVLNSSLKTMERKGDL